MAAPDIRGFNVIRKLGEGARAELFLARIDHELAEETAQTVVLKLYREWVLQPDWFTEVEALERAAGVHVVGLHDIAQTASGRTALVLERLETGSLTQLLRQRDQLSVGEAITIAAPIVATLERLHTSGVHHGAISTDAVMFSKCGAPTLARFGVASLVDPGMPPGRRAANEHLAHDVMAALTLVSMVLDRVDADRDVLSLRDWLALHAGAGSPTLLLQLAARLFDLGDPQAVRTVSDDALRSGSQVMQDSGAFDYRARLINAAVLVDTAPLDDSHALNPQTTAAFAMPQWLSTQLARWFDENPSLAGFRARVLAHLPPSIVERFTKVGQSLKAVRPRVWGLAIAVAVVALAVSVFTALGDSQQVADASSAVLPNPAEIESAESPGSTATPLAAPEADDDFVTSAIQSDDPRRAVTALLAAREDCIRDLSVLCLDSVAQLGSSALEEDQALIQAIQSGAELPQPWTIDAARLTIVERLGDSALISTGENSGETPGTILVMMGADGWRVRDYFP